MLLGILYVVIFSPLLLRQNDSGVQQFLINPREYTLVVVVESNSPLVGKTLASSGILTFFGVTLFKIERGKEIIMAPSSDTKLFAEDLLFFSGNMIALLFSFFWMQI